MNAASRLLTALLVCTGFLCVLGRTQEIHPAAAGQDEEFERIANALKPGDELVVHSGVYSQTGRRSITVEGTPEHPIVIRGGPGPAPLLTRPADNRDRHNNIVFDCSASGITAGPHAAMPQVRNTTIVHNTIFNAPVGVRFGWSKATHVVFANNAVFCPDGTAIRADGLGAAVLRNNAVHGRLAGISLDGRQIFDGGDPAGAFADPAGRNFWPKAASPLRERADASCVPLLDFDAFKRNAPFDVGAYENDGRQNPGWAIRGGFKR